MLNFDSCIVYKYKKILIILGGNIFYLDHMCKECEKVIFGYWVFFILDTEYFCTLDTEYC